MSALEAPPLPLLEEGIADARSARAGSPIPSLPPLPDSTMRYLLVLDVEATCDNPQREAHEIIEWPVVAVDCMTAEPVFEFHRYVRPTENPTLSLFCKKLTGISQEQTDAAEPLDVVLKEFDAWLVERGLIDPVTGAQLGQWAMATDGPWDLNHFTARECDRKGIPERAHLRTYLNVRKAFAKTYKLRSSRGCSLAAQLTRLNLKFEGRPHSGIDDTRNIARVLGAMLRKRSVFCLNPNEAADPNVPGRYLSVKFESGGGGVNTLLRGPKKARGARNKAKKAEKEAAAEAAAIDVTSRSSSSRAAV